MNKSFTTNALSALLIGAGLLSPVYREQLISTGVFAFSGAFTNWLAVYMLFEKIPFIYGSGVVPLHFEDFKTGIKILITEQFFSDHNIDKFSRSSSHILKTAFSTDSIAELIDFDIFFDRLKEMIFESSAGSMLAMFGGKGLIENFRGQFKTKMISSIGEILDEEKIAHFIENKMTEEKSRDMIKSKLEEMIESRLEELTPQLVKEIIQKMIKKHLGWLVVWGGVFGGLIGLGVSFIN